ncbi:hypothetical protein EE612_059270 [Oryza sativa]|nr:hypothetical protein EE612_059270 [Oryza sativa]
MSFLHSSSLQREGHAGVDAPPHTALGGEQNMEHLLIYIEQGTAERRLLLSVSQLRHDTLPCHDYNGVRAICEPHMEGRGKIILSRLFLSPFPLDIKK